MKKILTIPVLCALSLSFSSCSIMPSSTGDTKPLSELNLSDENIKKANEKKAQDAQQKVHETVNNYIEDALDSKTLLDAIYIESGTENPDPIEGYTIESVAKYFEQNNKQSIIKSELLTQLVISMGWNSHMDEITSVDADPQGRLTAQLPISAIKIGKNHNTAEVDFGKIQFYFDGKKDIQLEGNLIKLLDARKDKRLSGKENIRKAIDDAGALKVTAAKKEGQWKLNTKMKDDFAQGMIDGMKKKRAGALI